MSRPRVGILITTTWNIRNVLYSGLLEHLAQSVEPVLLARESQALPADQLNGLGVQVEPLHGAMPASRWASRLRQWSDVAFARRHDIACYRLTHWWSYRRHWGRAYRLKHALTHGAITGMLSMGSLFRHADRLERRMYARQSGLEQVSRQLAGLKLTGLVSTLYFHGWERPYLRAAHVAGLRTLCVIPSFDNLWVWGMLPIPFDYYAVWHDRMRTELRMLYPEVPIDRCFVTGTPQFDFHARPECMWGRQQTADFWQLEPERDWYLYTANAGAHTPTEPRLVSEIASAFEQAGLLRQGCMVVRPHPLDSYERWAPLQDREPQMLVRHPWPEGKEGLAQTEVSQHVAWVNLARHSAVCLNVGSSTTLDAAAVDCPVVLVNFAASGQPEEDFYYKQFNFDREHYRAIARHPGLRVAGSLAELVQHVRAYAGDRALDAAARRQLADEFCGKLDGQAARRLSEAISLVGNRK